MQNVITKPDSAQPAAETAVHLFDHWFDPIEAQVRERVRGFIQAMIEGELDETLRRPRYGRRPSSSGKNEGLAAVVGHRHGHRSRSLTGTFGRIAIAVPRARLVGPDGKSMEWKSKVFANLSTPHVGGRRFDRIGLPLWHQYAPCPPRAQDAVR